MRIFNLFSAIQAAAANPDDVAVYRFPRGIDIEFIQKTRSTTSGVWIGWACKLLYDSVVEKRVSLESARCEEWREVTCVAGTKFRVTHCCANESPFRILRSGGNVTVEKYSTLEEPEGGWVTSEDYPATTDLPEGGEVRMGCQGTFLGSRLLQAHFFLSEGTKAEVTKNQGSEHLELGPADQIAVLAFCLTPNIGCFLRTGHVVIRGSPLTYTMISDLPTYDPADS